VSDPLFNQNPDDPPHITPTYPVSGPSSSGPMEFPLRAICTQWIEKIRKGWQFKEKQFAKDARDCMRFFNGPYDFMYKSLYAASSSGFSMDASEQDAFASMPAPTFRMTFNKVAEAVQLFGPVLYHKNPYRQVNPRKLPDLPFGLMTQQQGLANPAAGMMMQQQEQMLQQSEMLAKATDMARAGLMEWMLNYTPQELGLKNESRMGVDEGLIKGAACLWIETYKPKGSELTLIGSFYDTVDNLVMDPDAERRDDCKWVARRCIHPVWQVEQEYGLKPGSLKAQSESFNQQAETDVSPDGDYDRKRGVSNDLFTYWKIWSKMGVGAKLTGVPTEYRQTLDQFGDFAYLVVAEGTFFPLNLPNDVVAAPGADQEIMKRLEWPTPFWLDDEWPFAMLTFHDVPRQLWPMSHFKPAMGELKFLNWAMSFVASKIRVTSRDFIAIKKSVGDEIKNRILHGQDLTLIELEATHPGTINEIIQFLQHPQFNGDIWRVIEFVQEAFDKRTGLSELMYGMTATQMRSAQEASVKSEATNVRPDDMANKVEDWMTRVAKLEAMAVRWHISDVTPLMGQAANFYWQQLIVGSDPYAMFHQLEYGIEAGSTKKPNKDRDAANMNQVMQSPLLQMMFNMYQMSGNPGQLNALLTDWSKAMGMDATKYLFPAAAMPPPPAPGAEGEPPPDEGGGQPPPKGQQAA
jgi:hypothetical protein